VNSQLQPDPNEETAALLRVLIYKVDNTSFGGSVPPIPQWSGPPHTIVQVQAILYASLATSLFSAFLAMLGKQWLIRYASNEMGGSVIECGQDRQRKLNAIATWYFEHVMESLPSMLQAALLLLGCALCRYLWEINTAIATVIICVTSLGVALYASIVAAGMTSKNCPYQTPGSRLLRSAALRIAQAFRDTTDVSRIVDVVRAYYSPLQPKNDDVVTLSDALRQLPKALAYDARSLVTFLTRTPDQQAIPLDLQCISWVLRKSLDKDVRLSTLESLASVMPLGGFDPTLVADCFNIFIGCVKAVNRTVVIIPGRGELAAASAMCLFRTFLHLSVVDRTSGVLEVVRQHFGVVFPSGTSFRDFEFSHTLGAIHRLLDQGGRLFDPSDKRGQRAKVEWQEHELSSHEHVVFAHALVKLARSAYQKGELGKEKVPRWILHFALHSLSLVAPPSPSVIHNCLLIIATDLGCDISNVGTAISDERYIHV